MEVEMEMEIKLPQPNCFRLLNFNSILASTASTHPAGREIKMADEAEKIVKNTTIRRLAPNFCKIFPVFQLFFQNNYGSIHNLARKVQKPNHLLSSNNLGEVLDPGAFFFL